MVEDDREFELFPEEIRLEDVPKVRSALLRYRIMAWIVGVLLVVLVCVGLPVKYLYHDDSVIRWTGVPHGYLYMVLLVTAFDLGRRVQWTWPRLIAIALAGTIPFITFVAEHFATKDVTTKLRELGARTQSD